MKICFFANADSIHSYRWVTYFAKKSHEVYWISLAPLSEGDLGNVEFYPLSGIYKRLFPFNILGCAIAVWRILKKVNPDVFHVHYAGVNGVIGALSGFHPFVLTAWGSDVLMGRESFWKRPLIQFTLRSADLITCDANHMKEAIIHLGVRPSKIQIVYFGIDTQKFSLGDPDSELQQALKISELSPAVISLRSFELVYDIATLIRAIPLVLKKVPAAIFLLGGKGSQEEALRQLVKNLGIGENVRFLGHIPNNEIPRYLRLAHVYVSTSLSDAGIAASTAEAMACGLPVVITDSGENRAWVRDGEDGFLVPCKDPGRLAEKVISLLWNREMRTRFGERARKVIVERNDYFKEMHKMENYYRGLPLHQKPFG